MPAILLALGLVLSACVILGEKNEPNDPIRYTVTYNANGGSGTAPSSQTVNSGTAITLADGSGLINGGCTFSGWNTRADGVGTTYASGASFMVTSPITLYAKWSVPGSTLQDALDWLDSNAGQGGVYTITLSADETIAPRALSYSGKTVSIGIDGGTTERTISLSENGSLFTVGSGVTLTLGSNVTLQGRSDNTAALVRVNSGGTLAMENGSKITGNTSSSDSESFTYGGGVCVFSSGTFTMNDGEITGNTAIAGGGVCVFSSGRFTMSGGEISGNTATANGAVDGFYVPGGGGGVYVSGAGTFRMSGGEISGNTASADEGGGVSVDAGGRFTMSSGEISGNTADNGGGVYSNSNGFTMSGGEISGNTADNGGGVYVSGAGTFRMSGGEISGNTAGNGGGVYVSGGFTKQSGGIIYGSDAESGLRNTAAGSTESRGQAVYANGKKRDSTAGVGVTLDSSSAGGWE